MRIEDKNYCGRHGECILLRTLQEQDAEGLIHYTMEIAKESEYMLRYPEEVTIDIEDVKQTIKNMRESETDGYIGVFVDGELAGNFGLYMVNPRLRTRHRCAIGIGIMKQYRNMGLASLLMKEGILLAKTYGYEQMELDVVEENSVAIHLYEAFGFHKIGMLPHAFKMKDGRYHDMILMMKSLFNEVSHEKE